MLRIFMAASLIVVSLSALAQSTDEVKGLKFGAGCVGAVSTFAPRLGTCNIDGGMSRIWCPNGKIFDRKGSDYERVLSSYVVRAICRLNQIL
jgi:hypothetical protein